MMPDSPASLDVTVHLLGQNEDTTSQWDNTDNLGYVSPQADIETKHRAP